LPNSFSRDFTATIASTSAARRALPHTASPDQLVPKLRLGTQRKKLRFVPPGWHSEVSAFGPAAPRQGCQKLAGGCRAATTPGYDAQVDPTPQGWQRVGLHSEFSSRIVGRKVRPLRGRNQTRDLLSGGVAALDPRLMAATPHGVGVRLRRRTTIPFVPADNLIRAKRSLGTRIAGGEP
jgi:hypothetical protein